MTSNARSWDEDRPIYRQLVDEIVLRIINCTYQEEQMLPSVRQLASDFMVNPLTVARAYRELEKHIESVRGVGLILKSGVRKKLLKVSQRNFLKHHWPNIVEHVHSLDLEADQLREMCANLQEK